MIAPEKPSYLERQSSSELLCLPYLDTDTSTDVLIANRILQERGYPAGLIRVLRGLFRIGLWHQFAFMWEWASLDVWDVVQGYAILLLPVGLMIALLGAIKTGGAIMLVAVVAFLGAYAGMARTRKRRGPS